MIRQEKLDVVWTSLLHKPFLCRLLHQVLVRLVLRWHWDRRCQHILILLLFFPVKAWIPQISLAALSL